MTDEHRMPQYDGMEYEELVAAAQFLWLENAKTEAENDNLVSVLHEVEDEAILAFNSLRRDCETITASSQHFFDKQWHAECETDRLKVENAELQKLARGLNWCTENAKVPSAECEQCPLGDTEDGELSCERLMRELRIEVE